MMRLPLLLRIMTLATLVSTARLTEPTMCANDTDFKAQSLLPEATGGARCEDASLYLLSNFAGGRTSWSDVTCQEIAKDVSFAQVLLHAARYCCGKGLPRCFDGSNMCKNAADFTPNNLSGVVVDGRVLTCSIADALALSWFPGKSI